MSINLSPESVQSGSLSRTDHVAATGQLVQTVRRFLSSQNALVLTGEQRGGVLPYVFKGRCDTSSTTTRAMGDDEESVGRGYTRGGVGRWRREETMKKAQGSLREKKSEINRQRSIFIYLQFSLRIYSSPHSQGNT